MNANFGSIIPYTRHSVLDTESNDQTFINSRMDPRIHEDDKFKSITTISKGAE